VPRIEVSIHEILTDPDHPMNLGSLPADEAIERIRRLYGFLPAIEDVSLAGGIATITITEDSPYRVDEARQTSRRGARAAERGNYQAAKEMFEEALEVMPYHAGTRRDLGMAYMEMGDAERAKQYVVEAIRLAPDDAWSYLVLGNLYLKMEGKAELAERYTQKAHDLDPADVYVLNTLGTLKATNGDPPRAPRSLTSWRTLWMVNGEACPFTSLPVSGPRLGTSQPFGRAVPNPFSPGTQVDRPKSFGLHR
jgi:tetratricopeptide (TPR) repeat protein